MTGWLRGADRVLRPLVTALILMVVLWYGFLAAFPGIGPRVGKSPADVWRYLFAGPAAPVVRGRLLDNLAITLRDAGFGFCAGMAAAMAVAALFVTVSAAARTFMPVAILMRSVPLVALAPLIVLIFGRDLTAVTVIAAIVVFFPALVLIMTGLREAPRHAQDVVAAYGGTRWQQLRLVAVPAALPAVFAAARISVPGALIGALLGEWLGSGRGLGSSLIRAIPRYQYNELWASVAVVTVVSILLYAVVGVAETLVLARYGAPVGKRP